MKATSGAPAEYTLSIRVNWGILSAFLFSLTIILIRLFTGSQIRRWQDLPRIEQFWLLMIVGWVLITPYVTIYMLVYVLLPLRLFDLRKRGHLLRMLALYGLLFAIFILFFSDPRSFEHGVWQRGFILIPPTMALLTPRVDPNQPAPPTSSQTSAR